VTSDRFGRATQIAGEETPCRHGFDGLHQGRGRLSLTQKVEHHLHRPERCHRICDSFAGDVGSRTVNRLEHGGEFSVDIEVGRRGNANAAGPESDRISPKRLLPTTASNQSG
jgi:hypothetical protein